MSNIYIKLVFEKKKKLGAMAPTYSIPSGQHMPVAYWCSAFACF